MFNKKTTNYLDKINYLLVFLLFAGCFLTRSSFVVFFSYLKTWDIFLPFIIYLAQRRSLAEGVVMTIFMAHLISLSSSAPVGFFLLFYLILFAIVRLLSEMIYGDQVFTVILLLAIVYLIGRVTGFPLARVFDHRWSMTVMWQWGAGLVSNILLGVPVYYLLKFIDAATRLPQEARTQISESKP